jgi:hypothetical protein
MKQHQRPRYSRKDAEKGVSKKENFPKSRGRIIQEKFHNKHFSLNTFKLIGSKRTWLGETVGNEKETIFIPKF